MNNYSSHRVAIVVSHPIQHFCPQYSSWSRLPGVDLKVFFASKHGLSPYHDINFGTEVRWKLTLDFDHLFLPGAEGRPVDKDTDSSDLDTRLAAFDPDVVICYGYAQKLQRRAIAWAKGRGTRLFMISDSELRHRRSWPVRLTKKLVIPTVLRKPDVFLTVGDANEAYYRNYGVGDHRLVRTFFPIDVGLFEEVLSRRCETRAEIRQRHGIPDDCIVVLMVGKLVGGKRQADLVQAISQLHGGSVKVIALLAGSGPDESALRALAAQGAADNIVFLGFVSPEALVDYYVGSDAYVHCSSVEAHSLAISEAVYSGLPVTLSDRCGSYGPSDDVRPGLNGYVYPCGDVGALAGKLARLAGCRELRDRMGAESRAIGLAAQALAHGKALQQALELVDSRSH